MNVLPKIVNKLEQFFDFLFLKEETVLKKFIRVIDNEVITFYIVRKTVKILGGIIRFDNNILYHDYNSDDISAEKKYYMDMHVMAARYTILANEWKTMLNHEEI
jgi:hypothetical protein